MKKIIYLLFVLISLKLSAQTSCQSAQPFCAGGSSGVTFPASTNAGSAQNGPNYGCLGSQPNPAWYYLQIGTSGNLDILIQGMQGNNPGQDVDFIAWGPFSSLANVCSSLTAGNIIDCSYSSSFTETLNIVNGVAGQYYMVLITNFANVNQNIIFNQYAGNGSTNCALLASNSAICAGNNATIVANNSTNLSNPSYSLNPGGLTQSNGTFVVTPTVTTQFTVYVTGTNNQSQVQTVTTTANVTVNPQPSVSPSFTQASCTSTFNAVNLGLTMTPPSNNYTVTWSPLPGSSPSGTQTAASNLQPGTTNVTVTAAGGCSTTTSFTMGPVPGPVSFTISPPGGIYSVTCANPSVNLTASPSGYNYTWVSMSSSLTGNSVSLNNTNVGNFTVTAVDPVSGCVGTPQTFTLGQNFTLPTSSVNPVNQVITCASGLATFTGTALSPTTNIIHEWYSPGNPPPAAPAFTNGGVTSLFGAGAPGTYTYIVRDATNGCIVTKTVSVSSASGFPTFQTSSTTNYSIGCVPLNQTTLCIVNAQSTNSAAVQFAWIAPTNTTATFPLPSTAFNGTSCTITAVPGTWTAVVQDVSNSCQTILQVPVLQNTFAPNVSASYAPASQTLTCFNPTILATGTSSTANTIVTWQQPNAPGTVSSNTIVLGPGSGPPTSSSTCGAYANYTVVATNSVNACKSTSVVNVSQCFRAPTPLISVGNPSVINCNNQPVVMSFTNVAIQSPTANGGIAQVVQWAGPAPQATLGGVSTYSGYVSGVYTLTVRDSYNGCLGVTTTTNIPDLTQPPVIAIPSNTAFSGCGNNAVLNVTLSQSLTAWSLYYKIYPPGALFTPSTAPQPANSPTFTGSSANVTVSVLGHYEYLVTNLITGCHAIGVFDVSGEALTADFTADPTTGYAPLTVGFNNTSATGSGATSSITSVWAFGNGTSSLTANPQTSALYTSPGTYTVMLIASRGGCIDTAYKVVKVDIPSKLEIPNVFTPNGDGNNDQFFLHATNLSEITASIFDRWGNLVYEVTSNTGNILWDGKNQAGKECAPGTYFYIIKATGKDNQSFEQKGNVSLYR